jgi:GT2 family glycosyltransferase
VPRLTIVIPAVDSISSLESTLVSVLENRPNDCEVIVVLNQPYDDPYALEGEVRFVRSEPSAGRVACASLGAQESRAPIVHLLASGCEVSDGWAAAAIAHFDDPGVGAVAPVLLDKKDRQSVLAVGVRYGAGGTRRLAKAKLLDLEKHRGARVLGPAYQAGFYRKSLLDHSELGLSDDVGDRLADVDLAVALRHAGYRTVVEPGCKVYTDAEPQVSRTFRQARQAERLFWRNAPAVGWTRAMVCHPWVVAAECVASLPSAAALTQLVARAIACFEKASHHRRHELLAQIADSAPSAPVAGQLRLDRAGAVDSPANSGDTRRKAG